MDAADRPLTHVFTDIEGSTRLWDADPDRMGTAMALHDRLAQRVVAQHAGRLVKSTGDGWYGVFDDPVHALGAALEFQSGLPVVSNEAGLPLTARCGVNTGAADARDGDYFGTAVNRAARIMSAAHGGQVLVGQACASLVAGRLPADLGLRELGRVRLRDLAGAEPVHQLLHASLREAFPALRGLDATPNNLPIVVSPIVGRTDELAELGTLLASHRLVTITGPGGIGKTRVALQLAADALDAFDDGAWLVELAAETDPQRVDAAIARALRVEEQAGEPIGDTIARFLSTRRALIVLDNCEHVLAGAASACDALLRRTARTQVVATSREALRVAGERVYPLPSLGAAAVELFAARARDHAHGFALTDANAAAVARICKALDGVPLAIELAAARARTLSVDDIEKRLQDRFRLLTGGSRSALPHHRTLEALVAWSHNLLDERERALFERLGAFVGSFDLEAAEAVGGAPPLAAADVLDLLSSLVDKSLVAVEPAVDDGGTRYRLLETLRDFAVRQLDAGGGASAARERHAAHYEARLRDAVRERDPDVRGRRVARLEREMDNLRAAAALRIAGLAPEGECATLLQFVEYCEQRGYSGDAARALDAALAGPAGRTASRTRARIASSASHLATLRARFDEAHRHGEVALADFRAHGAPGDVAKALKNLARIAGWQGDYDTSDRLMNDALAIFVAEGDALNEAKTLVDLGTTAIFACRCDAARDYAQRGAAVARAHGSPNVEMYAENVLGAGLAEAGEDAQARVHYRNAEDLARRVGDRTLESIARGGIGRAELALGNVEAAHAIALEVLAYFVGCEMSREVTYALEDIAHALALRREPEVALRIFAAAERARSASRVSTAIEGKRHEARVNGARDTVGAEAAERAWSAGSALALDDAVRLARATRLPAAG